MNYLGDNLGLTTDQTEKVLQLQDLTGIDDMTICRDVLQRHQWNLEVAVQEQLNIREGRPSVYATESRPPAVVNDVFGQHFYRAPPANGPGGLFGLAQTLLNLFYNVCYSTLIAFIQIGRRMLGWAPERAIEPAREIADYIRNYEEKLADQHPVFYQGTFSQILNDAKRELRFLLVFLHKDDCPDSELICRMTLSNRNVINYINTRFLFWSCNQDSEEGKRVLNVLKGTYRPFFAVLVLRENRMTVVGRIEGYCEPDLLLHRLEVITNEYEIDLVQMRNDRFEASVNRSLRAHQDEAFMESLRADQEKERRKQEQRLALEAEKRLLEEEARAEEQRRLRIEQEKMESIDRIPPEPDASDPNAVYVVLKLPSGVRLERRFLRTHSLEMIYLYVFCHPDAPDTFEITRNFPKRILKCRPVHPNEKISSLEEAGLQNREVLFVNDLDA